MSTATVVGGDAASGSVVLTGAAPTGGALVTLSAGDPLTVPASVTVPAGANEAAFAVATRVVGVSTSGTVNGTYGGASASMSLAVTRAEAVANFGVTGATESETCSLTNGGATLNCTFNGSTSTAPGTIVSWDWTYGVAGSFSQTTSSATLTMPTVNCSLIPAPPMPAGNPWFTMAITLVVHDNLGNTSAPFVNNDVRLFPAGTCGF
ncbi:MAG TPA: hypothetical protein VHZ73_08240 [Vicinamibacterales bacterium]|nr:hypothetical protein [Vicinamibacterales bacterium]